MTLSREEITELAGRARPIYERVAHARAYAIQGSDEPAADAELERWCRVAARGDWPTFEKRLRWDGIELSRARDVLRPNMPQSPEPPGSELPAWSETLNDILAAVAAYSDDRARRDRSVTSYRFLDSQHPCPFEDLFVPIVLSSVEQVVARTGAHYDVFTNEAHAIVERALLKNLAAICARALMSEFAAFRGPRTATGQALYRAFVTKLLDGQLPVFFNEYSVLGRLIAIVVRSWIDATSELLTRLGADRESIRAAFNVPDELGQVVSLIPDMSDPHNGRRFVVALTFANGFRLVYKPRDLRLELAFQQLVEWLNTRGLTPAMRTLTVLTRPDFGWVEFVEQAPCEGEDAARAYFTRMGTLLCLGYVFEGVDLHSENVMTSGAHPIVVDAEAFFYPKPRKAAESKAGSQALTLARDQVRASVLKTGMLPETRIAADGVCYDVSALGSAPQVLPGRVMQWQDVNGNTMRYDMVSLMQPANTHVPPSTPYVDDLVRGFEQTYRFLLHHRDGLIAEDGPFRKFADLPVRFMIRPTRVYGVLLQNGFHPHHLRRGVDRSITLDALSAGFLRDDVQPYIWPVVQAEHRALEQLDVPRFTATTDGTWLATSPQERIDDCFAESGYVRALARLRHLDAEDLYRQIIFIRGAFLGRQGDGHATGNAPPIESVTPTDGDAELTSEVALAESRKIAAFLDSLAIRSDDGTASWVGLSCVLQTRQSSVRLLDMGLHDGVCGIALFLSAFARITGETKYRDLARAALTPVQFTLRDPQLRERACNRIGIGGAFGVGSVVYSLVAISRLLDEPELLEDAALAASFVSAARVEEDQTLDVFLGSAGAILGLLKLYHATGDVTLLEQARTCARHIVSRQIQGGEQHGGWPGVGASPLSGLSHGAAGIAYALAKLHEVTPESDFIAAASAGIGFEQKLFVAQAGNWSWSDAPAERSGVLRTTWCRGAPGIALSRLGMLDASADGRIREDLDVALRTTAAHGIDNIDHLCCGNLGRADILFAAGRQLARADLQQTALRNAGHVVARAQRCGGWAIDEQGGPVRHGFFQGRAGIGYGLLRLTHPDALPAALMWQ